MNLLEKALQEENITKTAFAKMLGCHISYVTHLCKNRRTPSLAMAVKIKILLKNKVPVESWIHTDT